MIRGLFLPDFSLWSCVWQSMLLVAVGLVGSFILRHRSARAYQVLFLSMIAAVIVPILSILVKHYELGLFVTEPVIIQSQPEDGAAVGNYGASGIILIEDTEHKPGPIEENSALATTGPQSTRFPWGSVMLCGWIAASLILAARLLVTFVLGVRLLGRAVPLSCKRIEEAAHLARAKLGIDKDVKVYNSDSVRSPVIWCWRRRPVLLVPSAAGRFDNRIDWAGVLSHELAHYKRRDHISGLLAELAICALPWNPLLWWAKSWLVSLSEQACDDWVVAIGQSGTDYAESLLDLTPQGQMAFVPTVVRSKKGLVGRVQRILQDNCGNPRPGAAWALAVSIMATCFAIGVAFAQTRPAVKAKSANTGEALTESRAESATRLKRLGLLLSMYAADHEGKFPNDLFELEPYATEKDAVELRAFLLEDAIYIGKGKIKKDSPQTAVAFDKNLLQNNKGTNVLFADARVEYVPPGQLQKLGIIRTSSPLEILNVEFEPIRRDKNAVRIKVQNNSDTEQTLGVYIQTYNSDQSERFTGWGTTFFESIRPNEIKWTRFGFIILGEVSDATWVRLQFYNPGAAKDFDKDNWVATKPWDEWFKKVKYFGSNLEHHKFAMPAPVSKAQSEEIIEVFRHIQNYVSEGKYEEAWNLFTRDYQQAEFQFDGFEEFNRAMEGGANRHWSKTDFVSLEPKSVVSQNGALRLTAALKDQLWKVYFVQNHGPWKIDWLGITHQSPQFEISDVQFEPIREGKNAVRIKVQNNSNTDQTLGIHIQTQNPDYRGRFKGWGTTFFESIKPGETKWTRFGFKIYGEVMDSTWVRLQFYNPGPAKDFNKDKWLASEPWDKWFKRIKYSASDLEHYRADESQLKPASKSQNRAIADALQQFQNHIKNKEYEAAWQFLSSDFRDAELFGRFEYLKESMEKPYFFGFTLSRMELLALEPQSVNRRNGIFALTAIMKDRFPGETCTVNFIQVGDRWKIDSIERVDTAAEKTLLGLKVRDHAVTKSFTKFQSCIKKQEYEQAWGLLSKSLRSQYKNDFAKWKEEFSSDEAAKTTFLSLHPESVAQSGEFFTLNARYENQAWKIYFIKEDGQWKIYEGQVDRGDWQERLLPNMQKRVTEHFDIYYFKDSTAEKEIAQIAEQKEKGFDEICRFLETKSNVRIRMILFEDGETKRMTTGHQGAGWAYGNTIVEVYNEDQKLDPYHETTHVLMRPFGSPPAIFNEGFAVYMSERLGAHALDDLGGGKSSLYQRVKELKSKNEWIPLQELLTYTDIGPEWSRPPISYAEAGAFVKFLIERYGKSKFLQAYKTVKNSSDKSVQQQNKRAIEQIYDKSLQQLEKEWQSAFAF